MKLFVRCQLPLILYALLIFLLSSISQIEVPYLGFDWWDKVIHFVEYLVFGWLVFRAMSTQPIALSGKWLYTTSILVSVLFAASDEYHQSFVPGRSADWFDLLADTLGTFVAVFGMAALVRFHRNGNSTV